MSSMRLTVAVIGAALGIAACGGSGSPAVSGASKQADAVKFAQCMRSHGVSNFPDPGSNGHGGLLLQQSDRAGSGGSLKVNGVSVSSPAFQSAMSSCRSKLPNGGHPPPLSASQRAAMLAFSRCMRAHGLTNFPDPSFGSGGEVRIGFGGKAGLDPNSPVFQAAQKACGGKGGPRFAVAAGPPPGG